MKILVVDDEIHITELLDTYLSIKHSVKTFNDPVAALNHYQNNTDYDMIITDYFMPVMQGDVLIEKIQAIKSDQKIIVCSGSKEDEFFEMLKKLTGVGYVKKPFELLAFDKAFESLLKKPS